MRNVARLVYCRPPVILGVTNPFFAKTLQHWPHIVRLGDTLDIKKVKLRKAGNFKTLDSKPGKMTSMVLEIFSFYSPGPSPGYNFCCW